MTTTAKGKESGVNGSATPTAKGKESGVHGSTTAAPTAEPNPPFLCKDATGNGCSPCRMRVIKGSFFINIFSTLFKGSVGFFAGSQALMADAVHSLTDSVAFGVNYHGARAEGDPKPKTAFNQGLVVGSIMFLSGVWLCADNIAVLVSGMPGRPGIGALLLGWGSAFANWHIYRITSCAYEKSKDPNLLLCMLQNRANFISVGLAALGMLLADIGFVFCDPLSGLIIGCVLAATGLEAFMHTYAKRPKRVTEVQSSVPLLVGLLSCGIVGFVARGWGWAHHA